MKEIIFNKNGRNYKIIEIVKGRIYELKEQRKNGVFYKVSRFNDTSLDDAIEYCKNFKIENGNKYKKVHFEEF